MDEPTAAVHASAVSIDGMKENKGYELLRTCIGVICCILNTKDEYHTTVYACYLIYIEHMTPHPHNQYRLHQAPTPTYTLWWMEWVVVMMGQLVHYLHVR